MGTPREGAGRAERGQRPTAGLGRSAADAESKLSLSDGVPSDGVPYAVPLYGLIIYDPSLIRLIYKYAIEGLSKLRFHLIP